MACYSGGWRAHCPAKAKFYGECYMPLVYRIQLKQKIARTLMAKKSCSFLSRPFGPFNTHSYASPDDWDTFTNLFNCSADDIRVSHHWFNLGWNYDDDSRSACSDVKHIKEWFNKKCLEHLHNCGFEIAVYDAAEILHECDRSHQILFDSQFAKLVSTHSILDIDKI